MGPDGRRQATAILVLIAVLELFFQRQLLVGSPQYYQNHYDIPDSPMLACGHKGMKNYKKDHVHVLYGISQNNTGVIREVEVSLKSVLMNAPRQSSLSIHFIADEAASGSLRELFHRIQLNHWQSSNPTFVHLYNMQSKFQQWQSWVERHTHLDIIKMARRHTLGAFFRLFANQVLNSSEIPHVLYMDTDVMIMADVQDIWNHRDPSKLWTWGIDECSGFLLISTERLAELWNRTRYELGDLEAWSKQLDQPVGDQLILRALNRTQPDLVGILPLKWDVTTTSLYSADLLDIRPEIGMLHLNGAGMKNERSAFESSAMVMNRRHRNTWGLVDYYVRLPWSWARSMSTSQIDDDTMPGYNLTLQYHIM